MCFRAWALAAALLLTTSPLAAQGDGGGSSSPYETPADEQAPTSGDAPDGAPLGRPDEAPEPAPAAPTPAAPPPSPDPDATERSPITRLKGAVVLPRDAAAHPEAKRLARQVYRDARLRPEMSEAMAQILMGTAPAPDRPRQAEVAAVMKALATVTEDSVRRRLLVSLGEDLGAQLVIEVALEDDGRPVARVLRLPDERFVGVTLTASRKTVDGAPAWVWDDAVGILRGLLRGPPPGPRTPPPPVRVGTTTFVPHSGEEGDSDWDLLKSPWFWGGLGVVVTVGVTVLILSQTALNEPDVVMLEGRVGP